MRGRRTLLAATASLAAALGLAAVAQAGSVTVVGGSGGHQIRGRSVKGKVRSDGILTVGQPETITIRKFSPAMKFQIAIEPSPFAPECQNFTQECVPQPVYPAAGTRPFRTKRKAHATVTFVMPRAYEIFNDIDPTQSHAVSFIDGQPVHIDVEGFGFRRKPVPTITFARAVGRATAEVPPSS